MAVKAFRLDIVPEQAQVLAEALSRAAESSLFHPSIVEPLAAGVEGTVAYRAEEYVAAESLDVAMRHYAPAPLEKALPFITQLAGAIDFARAAGVGHGGLHPRDIFVTPDEARATGFGVVEALEQVGIRAPIRRPYSAPERIDGSKWSTPADVFALAAITFELLSAKRPAGTGAQIGQLPDGEHAAALHAVLARAMDDDPSKRFQTALAFAGALASAKGSSVPGPSVPDVSAVVPPAPVAPVLLPPPVPVVPVPVSLLRDATGGGEFEVEQALDPVHEALQDREPGPIVDDFVVRTEDTDALPDEPAGVGAAAAEESAYTGRAPMFGSVDPEPDPPEVPERSRPAFLEFAVGLVLGLLVGFAPGYFVGSRDRLAPAAGESAGTPAAAPAPIGPATPEKPGQYSEQKVTPPAAGNRAQAAAPSPATRAPVATRGHLVVKSTPPRASVMINAKWRGRTPLTLDALPFGTYVVRVVQPGFRPSREEVTLSARDASHTIDARLERTGRAAAAARPDAPPPVPVLPPRPGASGSAVGTGSLYVDSRPRGATVTVDGRNVGQTPLSLAEVAAGPHVVRIEMAGKRAWTSTARVTPGKMERVTGSLEDK